MKKKAKPERTLLSRPDWLVLGWSLAIKLLILFLGATAYRILFRVSPRNLYDALQIWNRWDAPHYLDLARFGYSGVPGAFRGYALAYFPLYPWLVWFTSFFTQDYMVAAFCVSGIALCVSVILLRRLAELEYDAETGLRAAWFLLIFPTAYFLHIGYTESLFLALVLGALLAARRERWGWAGALGALVCLSRPTSIVLIPTLFVEALHQFWATRRWRRDWLWLLLVPLGLVLYMLLNQWVAGSPFAFLRIRKEYFHISFAPPWEGVLNAWGNRHQPGEAGEMVGWQEFFYISLGLICTIVSWFKLRPVYATYMTGTWFLFASTAYMQSVPRYTLTMFPIFFLFALLGRNRFWSAVLTVWSLLFLALFLTLFAWGHWAF